MAEHKKETIEKSYIVPLRKGFINTPKYKKTKKAMTTLKNFIKKHMKSDDIRIGPKLNNKLWQHGIKNPPHKIEVTAVKDEKGIVKVELVGHKYTAMTKAEKEESKPKESKIDQLASKITGKKTKSKKANETDDSASQDSDQEIKDLKDELSGKKAE